MTTSCPDCSGSKVQVVVCRDCHGEGLVPDDACPTCGSAWDFENGPCERDVCCEACDGEGVVEEPCWLCDGFGFLEAEHVEDIKHAG